MNSNWHILNATRDRTTLIPKPLFGHRKNKKLKDLIVRSRMPNAGQELTQMTIGGGTPLVGNYKCMSCVACQFAIETTTYSKNGTGISLKSFTNCKTTNIVYLILCPGNQEYVGETSMSMTTLLTEHRSAIRTKKMNAPLVKHYVEANNTVNDVKWLSLEKIHLKGPSSTEVRKWREVFWIFSLDTYQKGMNCEIPWDQVIRFNNTICF